MTEELINKGLASLQDELQQLDSAVKQIDRAGVIAGNVVSGVKEIQDRFANYMQEVLVYYNNYLSNTSNVVNDNLKELTQAHLKQLEQFNQLNTNLANLTNAGEKVIQRIDSIDIQAKLAEIYNQLGIIIQAVATQHSVAISTSAKHSQGIENVLARVSFVTESVNNTTKENFRQMQLILDKHNAEVDKKLVIINKKLWNIKGLTYVLIFIVLLFFAMTVVDYFDLLN